MPPNPFVLKKALRKSMTHTLKAMSSTDTQHQSEMVMKLLLESPYYKSAKSVGCYLSMANGELQTTGIVGDILAQGKLLYTPYLPPPSATSKDSTEMKMLRLYSTGDLSRCPLDKWGILDPGVYRRDEEGKGMERDDVMDDKGQGVDLILVPGVAFDEDCNRLGRGKAYYDRFLSTYTAQKKVPPLLIALALKPQLLLPHERVPTTSTDFQLDGVLSPDGMIWRKGYDWAGYDQNVSQ